MGMTELFVVKESSVVGKFRDSSHDHGEDEIKHVILPCKDPKIDFCTEYLSWNLS
jgi:hypothetical protein